eukprot:scaffold1569_cov171-Amphora_coffeaeformis.AAC.23
MTNKNEANNPKNPLALSVVLIKRSSITTSTIPTSQASTIMSSFSWIKAVSTSRLLSARQTVVWMGGIAALSSVAAAWMGPQHHPLRPTTLLQADAANDPREATTTTNTADLNNNTITKPIYPDLRPPTPRWSWSSIFGMTSSNWRSQYQRLEDNLERHEYQAMPDPATVMIPSHAITGALLKEHYIEKYRIYSSKSSAAAHQHETTAQRTARATQVTEPQIVALVRVGTQVDGHEGIVHGGIIAILIDDVLGYGFYSIGWPAAFTANLSINYRNPVPAASILRIECFFEGQERRKLHWKIRVVDAKRPSVLYAEASSLFVVPQMIFDQVLQQDEEKKSKFLSSEDL